MYKIFHKVEVADLSPEITYMKVIDRNFASNNLKYS